MNSNLFTLTISLFNIKHSVRFSKNGHNFCTVREQPYGFYDQRGLD